MPFSGCFLGLRPSEKQIAAHLYRVCGSATHAVCPIPINRVRACGTHPTAIAGFQAAFWIFRRPLRPSEKQVAAPYVGCVALPRVRCRNAPTVCVPAAHTLRCNGCLSGIYARQTPTKRPSEKPFWSFSDGLYDFRLPFRCFIFSTHQTHHGGLPQSRA